MVFQIRLNERMLPIITYHTVLVYLIIIIEVDLFFVVEFVIDA